MPHRDGVIGSLAAPPAARSGSPEVDVAADSLSKEDRVDTEVAILNRVGMLSLLDELGTKLRIESPALGCLHGRQLKNYM